MAIAAPLGLAAAALLGPLVLWYLLRSRRPRQPVASTFLWRRTDRSVAAAVPWQRFRPDLTFWLVALAILLGALALAQPFLRVPARLGDHTILIVDASASMLADEGGPSRLELARREAADLAATMAPGQQISVIEAGSRARVLLSASSDPGAVDDALGAMAVQHGPADLADAFTLAAALERPGQTTVVHLYTDGILDPAVVAEAPPGMQVTAVGTPRPNLAITRLQAVPVGAGSSQVFVEVRNFGLDASQAELTLTVADDDVVSERFRLGARESADRVLTVAGGAGDVLAAHVAPVGSDVTGADRQDALSVDDAAYTLLTAPEDVQVTLATPGNVFLDAALSAVPGVELTTTDHVPTDFAGVDLLVVDRLPAPSPPPVPMLAVAATVWPDGVTAGAAVERPALTFQDTAHELLSDVDLSEVGIAGATPLSAAALAPLAGGPSGDLLLAGRLDGRPVVLLGFDLLQSNLPLTATWPVFVANTVSWLAGPPATVSVTAGTDVTLPTPVGAEAIRVSPPSGDAFTVDPAAPRVTVDQVGLWRLAYTGDDVAAAPAAIAVNPLATEGDLSRPAPDPVVPGGPDASADGVTQGRQPIGRQILTAVLALAVLEWLWVYGVRPWRRRRREHAEPPATAVRR